MNIYREFISSYSEFSIYPIPSIPFIPVNFFPHSVNFGELTARNIAIQT